VQRSRLSPLMSSAMCYCTWLPYMKSR
jgi:hypothetical protein